MPSAHSHSERQELLTAKGIADRVGATRRQVQIWSDAGVIRCLPETDHQGTGRQRLYPRSELLVAAVVAFLARNHLPIGDLKSWADVARELPRYPDLLKGRPKDQEWYRAALKGEVDSYLILDPFKKPGVPGFTREDQLPNTSSALVDEKTMVSMMQTTCGAIVINGREIIAPFIE